MEKDTVTIRAQCLCKAHTFSSPIAKSSLPLLASACHCTSCRHLIGGLCFVDVLWPNEHEDLASLKIYSHSPSIDVFSCNTCSTQMFCRASGPNSQPCVITGALENTPGLVRYDHHIFVADTKDGGCSVWLRKGPDGSEIKRWNQRVNESEEFVESRPVELAKKTQTPASPEHTPVWCHCKGVQFMLRSGIDEAGKTEKLMSDYPDETTGKYSADVDACDSCRLALGSDLIYWAYVPVDHLLFSRESGSSATVFRNTSELREAVVRKDAAMGTLTKYSSSEGVDRYHCSICSATIFYTRRDLPDQVDVAIGLLDHPDGARAEGLLSWQLNHIDNIGDTNGGWRESLATGLLKAARVSDDNR